MTTACTEPNVADPIVEPDILRVVHDDQRQWCVVDRDDNVIVEGLPAAPTADQLQTYQTAFENYDKALSHAT